MGAYALTGRGAWIGFGGKGDPEVPVAGDDALFDRYRVTLVNLQRHPEVEAEEGQACVDSIPSEAGRAAIAGCTLDGQQLLCPDAGR
jgi:tungstate transport system substrate-binding protein